MARATCEGKRSAVVRASAGRYIEALTAPCSNWHRGRTGTEVEPAPRIEATRMDRYLDVRVEVATALATGRPVVALESTVLAHGLPYPACLDAWAAMERAVRGEEVVPATIGLLEGRAVIGMTPDEIERIATSANVSKVSVRDIAAVLADGRAGATTVAATAALAARASIRVVATGGIGGVHRGGELSFDVSADLWELARSAVVVVCSGAKSVLDLPRTLEVLESLGVPVVGFRTSEFPSFYSKDSGLPLAHRVERPDGVASLLAAQLRLGLSRGIVVVQPPPTDRAIPRSEVDAWVASALEAADREAISGHAVTPFLLAKVAGASSGRAVRANVALLESNAGLAARIAAAIAA